MTETESNRETETQREREKERESNRERERIRERGREIERRATDRHIPTHGFRHWPDNTWEEREGRQTN